MTNVDTSSYSCKELVDFLEIHGTNREKRLIEMYSELNETIEDLEESNDAYSIEAENYEDRIADVEFENSELEDTIAELKEEIKALTVKH